MCDMTVNLCYHSYILGLFPLHYFNSEIFVAAVEPVNRFVLVAINSGYKLYIQILLSGEV